MWILNSIFLNSTEKYWKNPQFLVKLENHEACENENTTTILIALMQKDGRLKRAHSNSDSAEEFIQFRLYKVELNMMFKKNLYYNTYLILR